MRRNSCGSMHFAPCMALLALAMTIPVSCQRSNADVTLDTSNWQPFSIGRADMRLPPSATVTYNHVVVNEIGIQLQHPAKATPFLDLWNARVAEIVAAPPEEGRDRRISYIRGPSTNPPAATVLYRQSPDPNDSLTLEHWQQYGTRIFSGTTDAYANEVKQAESMTAGAFQHLEPDVIPKTKEDFAIEHGVVCMLGEGVEKTDIDISFSILDAQDRLVAKGKLGIRTSVKAGDGKPTLLARMREGDDAAQELHLKQVVFARGTRVVSGLEGEVSAYTLSDPKMPPSDGFAAEWEFGGKANAASAPNTDILMSVDVPQGADPNLLYAYWNALLASFRFR